MKAAWPQVTHICQLIDPDFWFAENANGPLIKSHVHSSKISQGRLPRREISGFWNIQGAIWPCFQITLIYSPLSKNPHFPTSSLTLGTIGCHMLHLWGVRRDLFACLIFSLPSYWWSWAFAHVLLFILAVVSYTHISISCLPVILLGWLSLCNLKSNLWGFFCKTLKTHSAILTFKIEVVIIQSLF